MNSIQNLWYGNMRPAEEPGANDKKCTKLWHNIYDRIEKLEGKLGDEEKSMLSRLVDDYNEVFATSVKMHFQKAFHSAQDLSRKRSARPMSKWNKKRLTEPFFEKILTTLEK